MAATSDDLDRSYRRARNRWNRLTVRTVNQVRDAYARATDALAARVEQTSGPVTRQTRTNLLQDLNVVSTVLNLETLALLQRGVAATTQDASTDALVGQLALGPLVGNVQMRTRLQSTAEATALAFISRTGADGLQLSDRVWRSLGPWHAAIQRTVESGIIAGQSHKELARDLRQFVSPAAITPTQIEEARKRGIAPVPTWQTERLARTEINAAAREATIMTSQTSPFYLGVQWVTSPRIAKGSYPICEVCRDLAAGTSDRAPGSKPLPDGTGRYYPRGSEPLPTASHPNCFPGDTIVSGPRARAAVRRWFEGRVVRVVTAQGRTLTVTPNHPILTDLGWVAAGELHEGSNLICDARQDRRAIDAVPDDKQPPALISEVVDALLKASGGTASRVPSAPEQFHGDGCLNGEIEVVRTNRVLRTRFDADGLEIGSKLALGVRDAELEVLASERASRFRLDGFDLAATCLMCGDGIGLPLLGRQSRSPEQIGSGTAASLDAMVHQSLPDAGSTDAEGARQAQLALAGHVARDQIVHVEVRPFRGHVFNLETDTGWYIANGIVAHNCRCSTVPIYADLDTVTNTIGNWLENGADAQPELQAWANWLKTPVEEVTPPVSPETLPQPPRQSRGRMLRARERKPSRVFERRSPR
jgi:hypothetical protein